MAVVSIQNLKVDFGGKVLFENVSFDVNQGDFVAILGHNGSGKSTIKNIVLDHVHLGTYINADELKVIGITGTKGKTTITFNIANTLAIAGKKTAVVDLDFKSDKLRK